MLFLAVPASSVASTGSPGGAGRVSAAISGNGDPGASQTAQLSRARAAALEAYRGALGAARQAGIRLHTAPGAIVRTFSVGRLREERAAWLHAEHRYRRIGGLRRRVVHAALRQRGVRYSWGGASPAGFDCSGLVMWAYRRAGTRLPHSSYAMIRLGHAVPRRSIQPGDLIFSEGGGHVGIYIGHGMVVHSPRPGDVVSLSPLSSWQVTAIRRIIHA